MVSIMHSGKNPLFWKGQGTWMKILGVKIGALANLRTKCDEIWTKNLKSDQF